MPVSISVARGFRTVEEEQSRVYTPHSESHANEHLKSFVNRYLIIIIIIIYVCVRQTFSHSMCAFSSTTFRFVYFLPPAPFSLAATLPTSSGIFAHSSFNVFPISLRLYHARYFLNCLFLNTHTHMRVFVYVCVSFHTLC